MNFVTVAYAQITDSKGHMLYNKEDCTKGKFAFTTEDYDMFEVCFESRGTLSEYHMFIHVRPVLLTGSLACIYCWYRTRRRKGNLLGNEAWC